MPSVKADGRASARDDAPQVLLNQVCFTYRGSDSPALRGVTLVQRTGEAVAVVGPSGAGKSTLAKCLNRIIPGFEDGVLEGIVAIGGSQLHGRRVRDVAALVGMVFQDFESQLFSSNVASEVAFAMEQRGFERSEMQARVRAALQAVGLAGFEGRDPATLSGGEKQRLAIAAVMALRPRVIVLDEPTTDLDPQGRLELFALIDDLRAQGLTLIIVEHDLEALRKCDRIILLREGTVVANAPPDELMPQVDLLEHSGVRPADLNRLCKRLGLSPHARDLAQAEAAIREKFGIPAAQDPAGQAPSQALPSVNALGAKPTEAKIEAASNPTQADADGAAKPPLAEVRGLNYAYERGRPVLHDVNLAIREGEFVAIVGPNGSGKSTLAAHIAGLIRSAKGQVMLLGRDRAQYAPAESARLVGFVFQNPDHQIFAATVHEEVAFGPRNFRLPEDEVARRVETALQAVGLESLRTRDPFLLGKGERRRLAVATALALEPRLLLLDEPTTGLDYIEQRRMMELLARLNRSGVAITIITHTPWLVASYAQRVIMMRAGRKIFDGPVREFFANQQLLADSAFRLPEITALGLRLGFVALSVDELADFLERRS